MIVLVIVIGNQGTRFDYDYDYAYDYAGPYDFV